MIFFSGCEIKFKRGYSLYKADQVVDAQGLSCPMPLLKAKQALNKMLLSEVLHVIASDAGSWRDMHSYTEQSAHDLLEASELEGVYHYWIRRG